MAAVMIKLPTQVKRGEAFEVQATLAHPMETGLRPDDRGKLLPRDIVQRFQAEFAGKPVLDVATFQALSVNPYFSFRMRVEASGELKLTWRGDHGFLQSEMRRISVVS